MSLCEHVIVFHGIAGIPHHSTHLNPVRLYCIQLNCDLPICQIVAGLQIKCMVNWLMRWEYFLLGFAENLHEISTYGWDKDSSSIVDRYHHCRHAGSICKWSFSIRTRHGAVWRNIQEPWYIMVPTWKSAALPFSTLFVSWPADIVFTSISLGSSFWPLPPLLPALPSSAWCLTHH